MSSIALEFKHYATSPYISNAIYSYVHKNRNILHFNLSQSIWINVDRLISDIPFRRKNNWFRPIAFKNYKENTLFISLSLEKLKVLYIFPL